MKRKLKSSLILVLVLVLLLIPRPQAFASMGGTNYDTVTPMGAIYEYIPATVRKPCSYNQSIPKRLFERRTYKNHIYSGWLELDRIEVRNGCAAVYSGVLYLEK